MNKERQFMAYKNPAPSRIKEILQTMKTIAVVGLSENSTRASHQVAKIMQSHGYRIIPVNPSAEEILGEKCYPSLLEVEEPIDIVNVFRRSETIVPIAKEAVEIQAKVLWLQLGIVNEEAADIAQIGGLEVIMDRCIKVDHSKYLL